MHRFTEKKWNLFGIKKTSSFSSYLLLIALMIPLLLWASFRSDFSVVYPKAQVIAQLLGKEAKPWHYLLFETAYASDFITIELFFRGFLIISLSKLLGRKCILPIALFYFSIHLGKPMFEAISSFFGGIILGTISYQSKRHMGWLACTRKHCVTDGVIRLFFLTACCISFLYFYASINLHEEVILYVFSSCIFLFTPCSNGKAVASSN